MIKIRKPKRREPIWPPCNAADILPWKTNINMANMAVT